MKLILKNKNILFLFLIGGMRNFMLIMPIIVLFFQSHGLSMTEIMTLQVVYSVLAVTLEIPSGYFADRFKRKYSLNFGLFMGALGMFIYIFSNGFWEFLLVELILGIGYAFMSGADSAYLYDELLEKKKEKKYQKIEGRYISFQSLSESVAAFLSGFLAIISFKLVIIVQAVMYFGAFVMSLFLTEHKKNVPHYEKLQMKQVLSFVSRENKKVKYLIGFSAIIGASTLVFLRMAQPLWKELGLPLAYFGIIWGILNLLVSVFSLLSHRLENYFSIKQIFILFWICSFIFYILLYCTQNIYIALILSSCFWIFRAINWPLMKDYVNKETPSKMRATVLSIKNLAFRVAFSIISPFIGYMVDIYSLSTALLIAGITFGAISGFFLILLLGRYTRG